MPVALVEVVRGVDGWQRNVPRQKLFDTVDRMIRDSGEHIRQVCLRIDSVEFCGSDQTVDCRGTLSTAIGTCKKKILSVMRISP